MSSATTTLTVRLPAELRQRLEKLARSTERSKSWLAVDALHNYVELHEWQVAQIKAGIHEADVGDFASDAEVAAVIDKWTGDAD